MNPGEMKFPFASIIFVEFEIKDFTSSFVPTCIIISSEIANASA